MIATLKVTVSPDELLQIIAQMPAAELADFTSKVLAVKARQTAATLDTAEENLLRAIYAAQVPPDKQKRLHALGQKLEAEDALATDEQREFQTLTAEAESLNATRIEKVAQLAALWGKPLPDLMRQLDLWRDDGE